MEEYRIRVLSPDGTEKHVRELDPPSGTPLYLVGGPRRLALPDLRPSGGAGRQGDADARARSNRGPHPRLHR